MQTATPDELRLDQRRWESARRLAEEWVAGNDVPAIGLTLGRDDRCLAPWLVGRQAVEDEPGTIREDAIFLVASITKPIVAMGALLLVERGACALTDRVEQFLPEFGGTGRHAVTLRHLLTHTSGLPDMLPDNRALRERNAPLSAFVEGTCGVQTDFAPGRGVQYQSMGFAVLGEVVRRITGVPLAEFLEREVFGPLGMQDTALGAPDAWFEGQQPKIDRVAGIRLPPRLEGSADWGWNSRYWRQLGAPWGGLLTTPADLARFAGAMLAEGRHAGGSLFSPATVKAATRNQLGAFPDLSEADRRARPWGYGWRLNWPAHTSASFGDVLGPNAYGHHGATGTMLWIDPDARTFAVLLTTQPLESATVPHVRLSNALAAAFD